MRADLLALGPDALATLANRGLVKRAQKRIARGELPAISEDGEGVVVGRFAGDPQVVTTLPPGVSMQDADCSCGARGKCWHRVALVLAYQQREAPEGGEEEGVPWSPGDIDDETLAATLGERALRRARRLIRGGMVVELLRRHPPSARLPTCTVRFLVPGELTYAHCDCAQSDLCEHMAVAVWAFRDGDARGSDAAQLGDPGGDGPDRSALDDCDALIALLLAEGVTGSTGSLAQSFARARAGARAQHLAWVEDLLDELEGALDAYRSRSARYREEHTAGLLAELGARLRAARSGRELPARFLLGAGEARETAMDHLRLVSIGARLYGDGEHRRAAIWLADPDTATVLLLEKTWAIEAGQDPPSPEALRRRSLAPRVPLGTLATGQLVTRVARRHASRRLSLGRGSGARRSSLSPRHGDPRLLPPPVLIRDLGALLDDFRSRPPRMLRPRIATEDFHVVAIAELTDLRYAPGEQALVARALDEGGRELIILRRFRSASPGALAALRSALDAGPTHVSGHLERTAMGLVLDPAAVFGARGMIVPDLEPAEGAVGVDLGAIEAPDSPIEAALHAASARLDEAVHRGLRGVSGGWRGRVEEAARALEDLGLSCLSRRLSVLADRARGAEAEPGAAAAAWLDAAIYLQLALELA